MSFALEIKNEIGAKIPQNSCCLKAECYGLFLFARQFSAASVSMVTESGAAARTAAQLAAQSAGVIADVSSGISRRRESQVFTLTINGDDERQRLLHFFGHTGKEVSLRINRANLENECCAASFLRGAFLSCGTATDPQKEYHLEFVVPYMNLAKDLTALILDILEMDFHPGLVNRKGSYVVYLKGSERIADFLAYLGAGNAAMKLMQAKMLKEVRNNVNRKTNFETANIDKTVSASAGQVLAIEKIMNQIGIQELPEDLQELAMLRYRNPEMSLRELGEALSEPLSRSGINHRLKRILEIAHNL